MSLGSPVQEEQSVAAGVMELEKEYLLQNYSRYPLVLVRGKGCYVYDSSGKRYLDLISGIGVNALGYSHPRIVKVIREQAARLIHTSNLYYHEYQGKLADGYATSAAVCSTSASATPALRRSRAGSR